MREFASLVDSKEDITKVVLGIENAVQRSFEEDQRRTSPLLLTEIRITQAEMKRRSQMCLKIFRELRGDLKWGIHRIIDNLPHYLRCELDGISWQPEAKRAVWAPT